jgi:PAS domain S-box-containing protein
LRPDLSAFSRHCFGCSAEEMIGTSIMRLIPPERQREEEEILSGLKRGERHEHFETVRALKQTRSVCLRAF